MLHEKIRHPVVFRHDLLHVGGHERVTAQADRVAEQFPVGGVGHP